MINLMTVVGARPQFIKSASVSHQIKIRDQQVHETVVHTGQHFDKSMSEHIFRDLSLPPPSHNLKIGGGTHGQNTGRMIEGLEGLMLEIRPDLVLVYGDTDTTLAGALAASKIAIPVAHVEAGLRSFVRSMPEEVNRLLTDHCSTLLFTPTSTANENLLREGIAKEAIHLVGDVMLDSLLRFQPIARPPQELPFLANFILATIHRKSNVDEPTLLARLFGELGRLASDFPVVMPLHPRTRLAVENNGISTDGINILPPVSYLEMLWLLRECSLVITDSGGLQKEAYFSGKPCVVARSETEWVELVDHPSHLLVGESVFGGARRLLDEPTQFERSAPFGDGSAGAQIVEKIIYEMSKL